MKRTEVLDTLSVVHPALAANDLIPVLSHYWFTGDRVMAYNDVIAISTNMETDFAGALKASMLHGHLSKADGKEVEFKVKGDDVTVKAGRSSLKIPMMPVESFLFEFPEVEESDRIKVDIESMVNAFEVCLQSLGKHISEPERRGITFIPSDEKELELFSTDSVTMSKATLRTKSAHKLRSHFTLSEAFCRVALKLLARKGASKSKLYFDDTFSYLELPDGTQLYGRLVDDPSPPDFQKALKNVLPKKFGNMLVPTPKALPQLLDRAYLVVSKAMNPDTKIMIKEGSSGKAVVKIQAISELGEFSESLSLGTAHPEVSVSVDLSRFRECEFSSFEKILFHDTCIVMVRGNDMYHLMSVLGA